MPENKKTIGYRPNINYKQEWSTERGNYIPFDNIEFESNQIEIEEIDDSIDDNIDFINNAIYSIFLPEKFSNTINEVYKPLIDIYNKYIKGQKIYNINRNPIYIENGISTNPIYDIYLNRKAFSMKIGTKKEIKAYVVPTNDPTNYVKKWESSNEEIAYVDENGIVYALKHGRVVIRAVSTYDKKDECIVDVLGTNINIDNEINDDLPIGEDFEDNDKDDEEITDNIIYVKEVMLDRTHILLKKNESFQLHAKVYPDNANNKMLVWSSNKNNIAVVSDNGIVHGVSIGTCMITVSSYYNNVSSTCYVTVIQDDINKPNYIGPSDTLIDDDSSINTPGGSTGGNKLPWKPSPSVPIININPIVEETPFIIENEFKKNIYDLMNYYSETLRNEFTNFYSSIFYSVGNLTEETVKDSNFLYNKIKISNKNIVSSFGHLLDLGLKQEKISGVKISFMSNINNFNQTINHVRNFLVSYELRKKYKSIPYLSNTDTVASQANDMLKKINANYSLRYNKTYENLFKYLSSSLRLTNEVLNDIATGVLSKGILLGKDGIKK